MADWRITHLVLEAGDMPKPRQIFMQFVTNTRGLFLYLAPSCLA